MPTAPSSSSAGSTRSAGCSTSRSPAPRTPCCCPGTTGAPPRANRAGPSDFLCELKDVIERCRGQGEPCGEVEQLGARALPPASRTRCATTLSRRSGPPIRWPARRGDMATGGRRWSPQAMAGRAAAHACRSRTAGPPTSMRCWPNAPRAPEPVPAALPSQLSVSTLVDLGRDPAGAARRLRRRRADAPRSACPAGHRVPRLGAAVLRCRAAVRPRRPARCGRRRAGPCRHRGTGRPAGRVHGVAMGGPHAGRGRGAVRDGHRRHAWCAGRIDAVFADTDRARRRRHGRGLEDRRSAGRRRKPAATRRSSSRCTGWPGRHCTAARNRRCGPPSTTSAAGRRRCPTNCRAPTNWRRCWLRKSPDLQRRGDHRDLQRQPGDRRRPHRPRLIPPLPHHVDVGREHREKQRNGGAGTQLAGGRRQPADPRWPAQRHPRHRCRTAGCRVVRRG